LDSVDSDVQYRIRAVSQAGEGSFSIRGTFTLASTPKIIQMPSLIRATKEAINLKWVVDSDGGSAITGYKVYQTNVTTGGEFLAYDGSRIPTVTSVNFTNVIGGHIYKYRVVALNRVGESELSAFSVDIIAASVPERPS
jgi:hypothetical protein